MFRSVRGRKGTFASREKKTRVTYMVVRGGRNPTGDEKEYELLSLTCEGREEADGCRCRRNTGGEGGFLQVRRRSRGGVHYFSLEPCPEKKAKEISAEANH